MNVFTYYSNIEYNVKNDSIKFVRCFFVCVLFWCIWEEIVFVRFCSTFQHLIQNSFQCMDDFIDVIWSSLGITRLACVQVEIHHKNCIHKHKLQLLQNVILLYIVIATSSHFIEGGDSGEGGNDNWSFVIVDKWAFARQATFPREMVQFLSKFLEAFFVFSHSLGSFGVIGKVVRLLKREFSRCLRTQSVRVLSNQF